ncbi:insulinase family protein [Altererythrobacter confluentis]|uniref:Insulinase family protein n=1 Tax=Allopontixanthobacter confluentis TaxID=1849021 RepID=A0A6L7GE80_9SPHN|nr:pitrilysin family protein [Allopontixanthobacter confluentis]MXP13408.1 insulinase family protein [Allopontixanthobacter confluentis]
MRNIMISALLGVSLTACAAPLAQNRVAQIPAGQISAGQQPAADAAQPASLAQLVAAVDIPYQTFTLENGLTTIVHTDRKAPIVGVTVYYRVGAKHEPRGRTGFAHLFEHLMFGGSENVENFDIPLEGAGSTSTNGSTDADRTNYVETVPTGALDLALFMESDRMGHLLGAVTQDKLDKQRGVVQNEKRQGDNQPYGLAFYALQDGLFPVGHPYRHSTIGSMADLDAASIADVRAWFIDNYGPNNVVLALSGDIDADTARPMVQRWFGAIPRGPEVVQKPAAPVTLPQPVSREMTDQVPVTRIFRSWSGPALTDPDSVALDAGMSVLGGLASSRLDNILVREEQLAVSVSAFAWRQEQLSVLAATMDVKPGVDRGRAEARLDEIIADFIKTGPTADELRRAATQGVSTQIGALEQVGGFSGKGATLAEGLLYAGNPAQYKTDLQLLAALTPAQVQSAMSRWLTRPAYSLAIVPGERTEDGATMGGWGDEDTAAPPAPDAKAAPPALKTGPARAFPPVAPVADLDFPTVERAQLTNGITVALARRTAVPKVLVSLNFDAGIAADALDTPGTQSTMLALLEEGTTSRSAIEIAEEQERLGASVSASASLDTSSITLSALSANLAPSLDLMADVVRNPAFAEADVARVRDQRLAALSQVLASPRGLASRAMAPILFGPDTPYGQSSDGLGDRASLAATTSQSLRAAHGKWLRPSMASITVVGDVTMERLLPLLDGAFGQWRDNRMAAPVKARDAAIPAPRPRIVLIDRPNSPQSVIMAGRVLPMTGRDGDTEALELANEVLGDGFLSRLNMNLREDKGWSYGVRSMITAPVGPRSFAMTAPVQSDRTGDAIRLLIEELDAFPSGKPVDSQELNRVTDGNIRGLPNRFETNAQVLGAILANQRLGRPDNYYSTLASRYRSLDATALDNAARANLGSKDLTFVIVGDRSVVEPQLAGINLPVEIIMPVDSNTADD